MSVGVLVQTLRISLFPAKRVHSCEKVDPYCGVCDVNEEGGGGRWCVAKFAGEARGRWRGRWVGNGAAVGGRRWREGMTRGVYEHRQGGVVDAGFCAEEGGGMGCRRCRWLVYWAW